MADDNILRSYRSNDAARRAAASTRDSGNTDPLAELARLIGQSDPFADMDRGRGQSSGSGSAATSSSRRGLTFEAEPPRADAGAADWRQQAAAMAREQLRESAAAGQRYAEVDSAIAAAKSLRTSPEDHFAHSAGYAPQSEYDQPADAQDAYADTGYADPAYADTAYTATADAAYDDGPRFESHLDHRAPAFAAKPAAAPDNESYFFDGAPVPAEQAFYDDPPRPRAAAASGVVTALIVFGCGILGTAGAYGYRTYYSGSRPGDAPIISADKTPIKVVPAAAAGSDGQSGKSAERVGGAGEQVVRRQEEPVTLPDPNNPRVVLPAPYPVAPQNSPPVSNASVSAPAPNAPVAPPPPATTPAAPPAASPPTATAAEGTKRVHTIAIHPTDGMDALAQPVGSAPSQPSSPPANQRTAARQQPPAPRNGGGPLSLDPQGQSAVSSYQPVAQERPRAPASTGGTQLASASSSPANVSSGSGGYMVQISSQRSEADAQASIRSLQSKYPNQLGEREAIVRRADLGEKGIYYRAMVGPFGTAGDADQFCGSLKAAGGVCYRVKN